MRRLRAWLLRLAGTLGWHDRDRDLTDELAAHVELHTADNIKAGMTGEEARRRALLDLGGLEATKERYRDRRGLPWLDALGREARVAIRSLRRSPGFTATAVLVLGLGIGANVGIFTVVNGVLLKPLPYEEPDELIAVFHDVPGFNVERSRSAPFLYFTYREQGRAFAQIGIWRNDAVSVTGQDEPEQVPALQVTLDVLPALRVAPVVGRGFSEEEDSPGGPLAVILSHGYWQRRFDGDPGIVGRQLVVDGRARDVIGVLPRTFRFLDVDADLVYPLQLDRQAVFLGNFSYLALARLRPGTTLAQAEADIARLIPIAIDGFEPFGGTPRDQFRALGIAPNLEPLKASVIGDVGTALWLVMGTLGIVLLVACANVANLALVRAEGRRHELALRAALGAGRGRLAAHLLMESTALALAGGLLGLGLAHTGISLLRASGPADLPRLGDIELDPLVLIFTATVSLLAGLALGLLAVLKYARPRLMTALRAGGRTMSQTREQRRALGTLVTVQVALALVLLVASGLMLRTFDALRRVDAGFTSPDEVQTLRLTVPQATVPDAERATRMLNEIVDRIASLPGVTSVSLTSAVPLSGLRTADVLRTETNASEGRLPPTRRFVFVGPGYFRTLGTPVLTGRDVTWTDHYERRLVALISESLARSEWGTPEAAIGRRVRASGADPWREVVGVVGDLRFDGMSQPVEPTAYFPVLLDGFWTAPTFLWRSVTVVVRGPRTGTEGFVRELHTAVWDVNPDLPLAEVQTLGDLYDRSVARTSLVLVLLAIAGTMALLLGAVGIYGVVAYTVAQRTRDIGIRMALGAQAGDVKRLFVLQAFIPVGIGMSIGLVAALGFTRLMSSLLFGVTVADPATYAATSAILAASTALAAYLPARGVTAVSPLEALRAE